MKHLVIVFLLILISNFGYGQENNPFDIYRSQDTIVETISAEPEVEEEVPAEPSTKLDVENPFSISHIPIRKNQYQQIESLKTTRNDVQKENISIGYLPLWLIIFSLCLLAYMLFLKKNHIAVLLKSLMNDNFLKLTNYEENGGKSIPYVLGYLLFLLNFGLFVYLTFSKIFDARIPHILVFFGTILLFFVGKHIVNAFFAWTYELEKETQVYDFTIITIRNLMSVIFLTFNILLVFGPDIWAKAIASVGAFIFISFLLSRYYKGLRIGRFYLNNYFFHFFLYFCAFEISPWIVVYKLVSDLN